MYDLETGKPEMRRGRPARRPAGVPPPCRRLCPKEGPDRFAELLPQNIEALQHYLECSATGDFPDDPLVRRHAAILRQVEKQVERKSRREELMYASLVGRFRSPGDEERGTNSVRYRLGPR